LEIDYSKFIYIFTYITNYYKFASLFSSWWTLVNNKMDLNILDLPVEILMLICKQFETYDDKKNFARAHPILWNAFALQSSKEVQNEIDFDPHDFELLRNFDFFLEWWGPNLTVIDICPTWPDLGDLMDNAAKFCPNLKHLTLGTYKILELFNPGLLPPSLESFSSLRSLSLPYTFLDKTDSKLTWLFQNTLINLIIYSKAIE